MLISGGGLAAASASSSPLAAAQLPIPVDFPRQEPDLVREVVGASHFNFARVKELVDARPALAKATWDWGFGDWETALGAASHTGQRDTALYLIGKGATPTIFSAAMLGQLPIVRAWATALPGSHRAKGPHGLTLLQHARSGGPPAAEVVAYLEQLGGADDQPALAPLSEADRGRLFGIYSFGPAPADRFEVKWNARIAQLTITRAQGGTPRNLLHLGAFLFYPSGAEAVRIRFNLPTPDSATASAITIEDAALRLTATRSEVGQA